MHSVSSPYTQKQSIRVFLFFLLCIATCSFCSGSISISGITVTTSTCTNNGTATVTASSNNGGAVLYYALGPSYFPWQSGNIFSSLYPGTYTVRVYDLNSSDSAQAGFTITGNYQTPSYIPLGTGPTCPGFTDGRIFGNADSSRGLEPFSWEIMSPVHIGPQSSDFFANLPAGNYSVRLTDACSNILNRTADLTHVGTGLSGANYSGNPGFEVIGCDTVAVFFSFKLYKEKRFQPLHYQVTTAQGSYTKNVAVVVSDTGQVPGVFFIRDTIAGVSYGDYLHLCLTDTCNVQVCGVADTISPFKFIFQFNTANMNCANYFSADAFVDPYVGFLPLHLTVRDIVSNTVTQDTTFTPPYLHINPQVASRRYRITISDRCGHIFQIDTLWPGATGGAPAVFLFNICDGCVDSTGTERMAFINFTSGLKLEVLSGPSSGGSTKPDFAYHDTIVYPKIFTGITNTGSIDLGNLPLGTYQYRLSDSCGHVKTGSFTVTTVTSYSITAYFRRTCQGTNAIYAQLNSPCGLNGTYGVKELSTNVYIPNTNNLQAGSYVFGGYLYSYADALLIRDSACWAFADTIVIPPYVNSLVKANVPVVCHGQIYLNVQGDTINGLPPFQYEIINGPQTFPLQSSGLFHLPSPGIYITRVLDSCGNSSTLQTTIDTAHVDSVYRIGTLCLNNRVKLASTTSPYFTYTWQRPNGSFYQGDTLVITPLTITDTGYYQVRKIINVNNCRDTIYTSYHLVYNNTTPQNITICNGQSYQFGQHTYTSAGTYRDTVLNQSGCDSIILTQLSVLPSPLASVVPQASSVCYGTDTTISATGGISYSWNNGASGPNLSTGSLDSSVIYIVTVTAANGCMATAQSTINVNIPLPVTIQVSGAPVCIGQSAGAVLTATGSNSYLWNTGAVTSGITVNPLSSTTYSVTGTDANMCTASAVQQISAIQPPVAAVTPASLIICKGSTDSLTAAGGSIYAWSTLLNTATIFIHPDSTITYSVTVSDVNGCTGTAVAAVTVLDTPVVTLTATSDTICYGDTVTLTAATSGLDYYWSTSDTTSVISVAPVASQAFYVTTTGINGCSGTAARTITVNHPQPLLSSDVTAICNTGTAHICCSSGFASYVWNTGSVDTCFTTDSAGTYSVQVTDLSGCSAQSAPLVISAVANFTVQINADTTTICANNTVHICAPSGYIAYTWNNGNTNACISSSLAGNYYVTVTDNTGCTAESNHLAVNVLQLPPVAISVNHDTLNAYDAVTYQWFLNGDSIPGATSNEFIPHQSGNYQVAVTDTNGCGALSNDVTITINSINGMERSSSEYLYPNPAANYTTLTTKPELTGGILTISNPDGRKLYEFILTLELTIIDTRRLPNGIYFIIARKGDKEALQKLIVEH